MAGATVGVRATHVNHVVTLVRDTNRSLEFYCGLLGIKQIPSMVDPPNITWLQLPSGVMLHLVETENVPGTSTVHHAFEVEDFESARQALEERSIEVRSAGVRKDGQRYLFIMDPDGNLVELCTSSGFSPPMT